MAGIGNVFLGDDGFGVEVVRRLAGTAMPDGVTVADFGIRGVHLAYELLEGWDNLVLVDAMPGGEPPGTITVVEPDRRDPGGDVAPGVDAHRMDPGTVLGMLAGLGGHIGRVLVVGCEPAVLEEGMELSPPVTAAVGEAVHVVTNLVAQLQLDSTGEM